MRLHRRTLVRGLGAALVAAPALGPLPARAQAFPNRPPRVVLVGPAGGLVDIASRSIADAAQAVQGHPWIVEARPGGNGIVAAQAVLAAPADGHSVLCTVSGQIVQPFLMKAPFDLLADFAPLAMIGVSSGLVCVPPSLPVSDLKGLVAYARERPGKLNYLNPGNGTGAHLIPEMLNAAHGASLVMVAYKGLPPGIQDLLAGRIELGVISSSLAVSHARTGALKAIAVVGESRLADLPGVPTMKEQGFGDIEVRSFIMLLASAKTPRPLVESWNAAANRALQDAEARRRLAAAFIDPMPMSADELGRTMKVEYARLGKLIVDLGIRPEGA